MACKYTGCQMCGCPNSQFEMIMVKDDLWKQIESKCGHQYICRNCIEEVLGRKLTLEDIKFYDKDDTVMIPTNFEICKELNVNSKELRYMTWNEWKSRYGKRFTKEYIKMCEWYKSVFK